MPNVYELPDMPRVEWGPSPLRTWGISPGNPEITSVFSASGWSSIYEAYRSGALTANDVRELVSVAGEAMPKPKVDQVAEELLGLLAQRGK